MLRFRIIKYVIALFLIIVSVLISYTALTNFTTLPSLGSLLKKDVSKIDDTPLIITEIKNIAELLTQHYYDECIIDSIKIEDIDFSNGENSYPVLLSIKSMFLDTDGSLKMERRFVLIASGIVKAGFDLSKIDSSDVTIKNNCISIEIPTAEVIDVIINPSGFETFDETGIWTFEERQQIQIRALSKLKANALEKGIIEKSEKHGEKILQSFFKSLGFEKVNIEYRI